MAARNLVPSSLGTGLSLRAEGPQPEGLSNGGGQLH
jgi:hypothetical protein